jgi:hypothetical protein
VKSVYFRIVTFRIRDFFRFNTNFLWHHSRLPFKHVVPVPVFFTLLQCDFLKSVFYSFSLINPRCTAPLVAVFSLSVPVFFCLRLTLNKTGFFDIFCPVCFLFYYRLIASENKFYISFFILLYWLWYSSLSMSVSVLTILLYSSRFC